MSIENIIVTDKATLQQMLDDAVQKAITKHVPQIVEEIKADQVYTTAEVSEILKVSESTLSKWRKQGKITYMQQGATVRYSRVDVLDCLDRMSINGNL